MINKLIDEINIALNNGLYLVALTATLTLPDVCGKVEFSTLKTGERYKQWYAKYVPDGNLPADMVYALRCSLLHEGSAKVKNKDQIHFELMTNRFTQPLGIDFCIESLVTHADGTSEQEITVYVGFLCTAICKAAKKYYTENKDRFSFLNYRINDLASMFGWQNRAT